ncbi:isoprenylcysteine carboxyl methyltransferase family protein [Caldalkalibacillus thermarum TA2.A1]|uniref:Isoprenylcysteine carboxyl methyltransferase family protein n=1 Tax=Caldalkalibacillus thermarum (strain TA2.A1) TaxID=986075 RepID=A0A8X8I6T5_CALTT|nr:isoprenylcysteine carboxyl methyltransferase family protein [Caldalkalibacillus thermarum TA2.A1]
MARREGACLTFFWGVISFVIAQRLLELGIAARNGKWMKAQGAYEVGREHYKYIVLGHVGFFLSLILEVQLWHKGLPPWWAWLFAVFVLAQVLRVWCISSLGKFWNTRIFVLPGVKVVTSGPYRFVRHPNYAVVIVEFVTLPLMFEAYFTAGLFTLLKIMLLAVRIPLEEKALQEATNYAQVFGAKSRLIP